MISHKNKYIFIHIPKTAGSSINRFYFKNKLNWKEPDYDILYGYCPRRKIHLQHATPLQLVETGLITTEQWESYFTFTFIRNPFDRAYSDYLWIMKDRNVKGSFKDFTQRKGVFRKILRDKDTRDYRGDHLVPQVKYIETGNLKKIDFIGRFENFKKDINQLNQELGFISVFDKEEKKNLNRKSHYSFFYNNRRKKMIENLYAEDIEYFNYSYEERKKGLMKVLHWI